MENQTEVCNLHYDLVNKIGELTNRIEAISKVQWKNGEEVEIPITRALEFIMYDLKEIKSNTSLWTDSTKIIKSIAMYFRKHKVFITILVLLIVFVLSRSWFTDLVTTIFKHIFN